jgi:diadenosine tetraphosphatase ApaH/serine/threonine PP2A family protein phosphatase
VWEYILDSYTAAINFEHFETPYCLVGHTHVPIVFEETDPNHVSFHRPDYTTERLLADNRLIINPGSVGQPRDSDPRAAYALLDTDTNIWQFKRVDYPITITQDKMRQYGIPSRLIKRLEFGL